MERPLTNHALAVALAAVAGLAIVGWLMVGRHGMPEHAAEPEGSTSVASRPGAEREEPTSGASTQSSRHLVPGTASASRSGPGSLRVRLRRAASTAADSRIATASIDSVPIVDARVLVLRAPHRPTWQEPPLLDQRTDAGGEAFAPVVSGACIVLTEHGVRAEATVDSGESKLVEITVPRGLTLDGRVVDADGQAAPDARVLCRDEAMDLDDPQLLAVADAAGRFVVLDLQPSRRMVWAEAPGHAPAVAWRPGGPPGARVAIELVLGACGHRLAGEVVDERDQPVAHAMVGLAVAAPAGEPHRYATTIVHADADGRFAADWMPVGEHVLLACEPEPGRNAVTRRAEPIRRRGLSPVSVRAGADNHARVVLREHPCVTGTVRDTRGRPVADVAVAGLARDTDFRDGWLITDRACEWTGRDGRFRIAGLLPIHYRFVVDIDVQIGIELDLGNGIDRVWDPEPLPAMATLRVRVIDGAGRPCAGWSVQPARPAPRGRAALQPWTSVCSALTDAAGRVAIDDIDSGQVYRVYVHAPLLAAPGGPAFDTLPCVVRDDVRPGAEETEIQVTRTQYPSVTLTGRVLGADGAPVSGTRIAWRRVDCPQGFGVAPVFADLTTGAFTIGLLTPGTYTLHAEAHGSPGWSSPPRAAGPGETIDFGAIRFAAAAFVEARWRTASGQSPAGATVLLRPSDEEVAAPWWIAPVPGTAIWRSDALAAGTCHVFARADGVAPIHRVVTLTGGQTVQVDLEPIAAIATEITAVLEDHAADKPDGTWRIRDGAGAIVFEDLLPPRFDDAQERRVTLRVSLRPGRYRVEVADAETNARASADLDVGSERAPRLCLRVR